MCFEPVLGWPSTHGPRSARAQVDVKVFRAIQDDIAAGRHNCGIGSSSQLATVIGAMNAGRGPDLLGVCEVENRFVIDLVNATRRG